MQIITEKGEYVTPIQMADALIRAEIQIDNPSGQLTPSIQKALAGKEQRDVIECQMFNARELLELGHHLTAYAMRVLAEEKNTRRITKYASKKN